MRGEPTYQSGVRKAWEFKREKKETDRKDWDGHICQFQLNVPGAHAFWSWWMMAVVHLRPIEGVKPAYKQYPEAEYEMVIMALHPDEPVPDPDGSNIETVPYRYLNPPDLVHHFHGINDAQAKQLAHLAAKLVVDGQISPDSDFRRAWKQIIDNTVEHLALSGHPNKENPS